MKARKPHIGDIYELKTATGLAYVQYSHEGLHLGDLVRVLPGTHAARPDDFTELARQAELYFTFIVIAPAVRNEQLELVAHQTVPESSKMLPVMRKAGGRARDGRVLKWFIGRALELSTLKQMQQALHVESLTPEQKKLSLVQIWPVPVLADAIERGWLPELAEELEERDREKAQQLRLPAVTSPASAPQTLDHYFYFAERSNALKAAQRLQAIDWAVQIRLGADGTDWLLLAKQPVPIHNIDDLRQKLEQLAEELGGEYDGWGAPV